MKLQILGCHGGELPKHRSTCFLLDGTLALDAGSLCSTLSLEALCRVDDIVLTHSHFDHIKDIPLMADLVVGRRDTPVRIHCSRACAQALKENLFNDILWPNFTEIPNKQSPVMTLVPFDVGQEFTVGRYHLKSIRVSHPVESCGFVVRDDTSAFAISGDTGPTQNLWDVLNATPRLRAVLLETSFPNELQDLATLSGHLTPGTLAEELKKFDRRGAEVLLYHLKPGYVATLKQQLRGLPVQVLELGDVFEF